eukprot:2747689-Karenia_brevis.AAC.1
MMKDDVYVFLHAFVIMPVLPGNPEPKRAPEPRAKKRPRIPGPKGISDRELYEDYALAREGSTFCKDYFWHPKGYLLAYL